MPNKQRHDLYLIREKRTGMFAGRGVRSIGRVFTDLSALKNHIRREQYPPSEYEIAGFDLILDRPTLYEIGDL